MMTSDRLYHMLKSFLCIVGVLAIIGLAFLLLPIALAICELLLVIGLCGLPVWVVVYLVWRARRKKKGLPI